MMESSNSNFQNNKDSIAEMEAAGNALQNLVVPEPCATVTAELCAPLPQNLDKAKAPKPLSKHGRKRKMWIEKIKKRMEEQKKAKKQRGCSSSNVPEQSKSPRELKKQSCPEIPPSVLDVSPEVVDTTSKPSRTEVQVKPKGIGIRRRKSCSSDSRHYTHLSLSQTQRSSRWRPQGLSLPVSSHGSFNREDPRVNPSSNPDLKVVVMGDKNGAAIFEEGAETIKSLLIEEIRRLALHPFHGRGQSLRFLKSELSPCDQIKEEPFDINDDYGSVSYGYQNENSADLQARAVKNELGCTRTEEGALSHVTIKEEATLDLEYESTNSEEVADLNLQPTLTCYYCDLTVQNKSKLKKHIVSFHSAFFCGPLPLQYLHNHKVILRRGEVKCPYCRFKTPRVGSLKLHIMAKHTGEKPVSCPECDNNYVSLQALKVHLKSNHSKEQQKCSYCDFSTRYISNLKSHIRAKHTGEKPYKCAHCDFSSTWSNNLKAHVRSKHTMERNHECHFCDYKSNHSYHLKQHLMAKHTGEKPKQCPYCDYKSVWTSTLKSHVTASHTKEKPHLCPYCTFSTADVRSLRNHVRSKHSAQKPYKCSQCDYTAALSTTLKQHINNNHTNHKPYVCLYCNYSSSDRRYVKSHVKNKHPKEKPYHCTQCDFKSAQLRDLKSHLFFGHRSENLVLS